jgi:hypothetical protein
MAQTHRIGAHKTTVSHNEYHIYVTYHTTTIVDVNRSADMQTVTLRSGGWLTPTTKLRMNQASNELGLGYHVFQKDHVWYVETKAGVFGFREGMRIDLVTGETTYNPNEDRMPTELGG